MLLRISFLLWVFLTNPALADRISFTDASGRSSISGSYSLTPLGEKIPMIQSGPHTVTLAFEEDIFAAEPVVQLSVTLTWRPQTGGEGIAAANVKELSITFPVLLKKWKEYSITVSVPYFRGSRNSDVDYYENLSGLSNQPERFFSLLLLRKHFFENSVSPNNGKVWRSTRNSIDALRQMSKPSRTGDWELDWLLPPDELEAFLNSDFDGADLESLQKTLEESIASPLRHLDKIETDAGLMSLQCSEMMELFTFFERLVEDTPRGSVTFLKNSEFMASKKSTVWQSKLC